MSEKTDIKDVDSMGKGSYDDAPLSAEEIAEAVESENKNE